MQNPPAHPLDKIFPICRDETSARAVSSIPQKTLVIPAFLGGTEPDSGSDHPADHSTNNGSPEPTDESSNNGTQHNPAR
jgi:hypothetical protein